MNYLQNQIESEKIDDYTPKRLDITARYQGTKVTFASLLTHLDEDISELENLIKDGDRELFEDILRQYCEPQDPGKDQCVESVGAENEYADEWHGYVKRSETESQMEE